MADVTAPTLGTASAASAAAAPSTPTPPGFDATALKADFPILGRIVHGRPVVYLDSASSSQRPQAVLDAMDDYYATTHANVHRGVYAFAEEADRRYEAARTSVGRFLGAPDPEHEVIFTKNATEALNLVAATLGPGQPPLGRRRAPHRHGAPLQPGPLANARRRARPRAALAQVDDAYQLDLVKLDQLLDGVKLVACTAMSNVLGTIPPFADLARAAHEAGAVVVADGAQSVPHLPTDVGSLGCDFLAFSAHKMLGPTGIGVLWGRRQLLEAMPPFLGGGGMIRDVRHDGFTPNELPWKYEAGTPPIAEAVGLGTAVDYLEALGIGCRADARDGPHRLRPRGPGRALRRRPAHLRAAGHRWSRRRAVAGLPRRAPP